jgi:sugar transferase (PEP-CTERM/EpsH1 system associated)
MPGARSPTTLPPMSRPALVFLCQRIPYPPIKGDRITSFNLLRHLTSRYRVFLGTFVDDPADNPREPLLASMVEDMHIARIRKPWAFLRALPRWLAGEPISFALFRSRRLDRWLDAIGERHDPVAIVAYSSNISTYAVDKFRQGPRARRRILVFGDVDSEKFVAYAERASGFKRWLFATEARRVRSEERRLAAKADKVTLVTEEEVELARSVFGEQHSRIALLPNGVDTAIFSRERYPDAPFAGGGAALIFTGAMDYPPNVEAVVWFARKVFPAIRDKLPAARFFIVGINPAREVKDLAGEPSITVTGRVESVASYLAHAQVAVAPLQIARGVQNKVLEAMAMALPVVASRGAMTGIAVTPGRDVVSADEPREWIDACLRLLGDPAEARRIGNAARRLVLERYNWEAQFARLDALLAAPETHS